MPAAEAATTDGMRDAIAIVVAAFLFTIAYATTRSLWWPMLIHIAMPLLPALIRWRMAKTATVATS